jgi:hypothetical protein
MPYRFCVVMAKRSAFKLPDAWPPVTPSRITVGIEIAVPKAPLMRLSHEELMEAVRAVPDYFVARMTSPNRLGSSAYSPELLGHLEEVQSSRRWSTYVLWSPDVILVVGAGRLDEEPISQDLDEEPISQDHDMI